MRVAVLLGLVVVMVPRPADACIPAFDRAIVGAPAFEPADAVAMTSEDVEVKCDEDFTCTVVSSFRVTVTGSARATVSGTHASDLSLAVGDRAPGPAAELGPADTRLVLTARVRLPAYIDGCFRDGVIARHPYVGSAPAADARVLQLDTTASPRVRHPPRWDLVVDARAATRRDPPTTRLWFRVPGRRITHGGPFALVGAASGDGRTLRVRGGWEAAVGLPWLVFAVAGDTDAGDAWRVALTAEPTTRAWLLPISLGAGGGVVFANGTRVGGRGQLSIALGPARVAVSADVVAAAGGSGVDVSVAALIGGSL
jgi:hypothetical protein